jgi:SpoVK/Ycf46/Vps4 family AAA+-type ATPase
MQEALTQKRQMIKKSHILEFCSPFEGFSQVGGLNNLKEWFNKRREAYSAKGIRFGLQPPKGVVLVGVPGCGKSLCAKALAKEWGVPLLRLDLGKIFNKFLGASEANLRKSLHVAESVSPCILWIDELEKAFSGLGQSSGGGLMQRIFGIFLDWLSEKKSPVFVVATANDINRLPAEFLRKGRFDELFFVDLPNERERKEIFDVHIKDIDRESEEFDLDLLVKKSHAYTGAEIRESVISALYRAFQENERELRSDDIIVGLADIKPIARTRQREIAAMQRWAQVNARPAQAVSA